MRRTLSLLLAGVLVLASCGGDSSDDAGGDSAAAPTTQAAADSGDTSAPATTAPATTAAPEDDNGSDDGGGPSVERAVGFLTIAGETYQFADTGFPTVQCSPAAFGVAFLSTLIQVDAEGNELIQGSLTVNVPFKGDEETAGILPQVRSTVDDVEWIADEEFASERDIPEGSSQVDSYEISGNTITGTATFYDEDSSFGANELVIEQGTFEVSCADE